MAAEIIYPPLLRGGDMVALLSPASKVKREYVEGAYNFLSDRGYRPILMEHVCGPSCANYSAGLDERRSDFINTLVHPDIRAIFCTRGGYGCVQIAAAIRPDQLRFDPKWVIGFSDVSALHALWLKSGVASLHAPMAKHITEKGGIDRCVRALMDILERGRAAELQAPADSRNITGHARGRVAGGNLAVLNGLASTPLDILSKDYIAGRLLFIEDISERVYAIDRMLWRLYLSGALASVAGIVVGQFTDYPPDAFAPTMEDLISRRMREWGLRHIPVGFGFPIGHVDYNMPIVEGAQGELTVTESGSTLKMKMI